MSTTNDQYVTMTSDSVGNGPFAVMANGSTTDTSSSK